MQEQTARQQARARARQARAKVRQEQAQRERRLAKWGEQVAVARAERDAMATEYEQRAGRALKAMIQDEGLTVREALRWCGAEGLTVREAHRFIREAAEQGECDEQDHARHGAQAKGTRWRREGVRSRPTVRRRPRSVPGGEG